MLHPVRALRRWPFALLALALAAAPAAAVERLGDAVRPTAQSIALELDPAREDYRGRVEIDLEVAREVPAIRLHTRGQAIESAELQAAGAAPRPLAATPGAGDVVALGDGRPIPAGPFRLTIAFTQKFNTQAVALYRTVAGGEPYLFTQFEAVDARERLPLLRRAGLQDPLPGRRRRARRGSARRQHPDRVGGELRRLPDASSSGDEAAADLPARARGRPLRATSRSRACRCPAGSSPPAARAPSLASPRRKRPAILAELERWFDSAYPYDKLDLDRRARVLAPARWRIPA